MWAIWVIGGILVLVIFAFLVKWLAPRKCPKCKIKMRLHTRNCGKTKKYVCPKCNYRIDTGIPIGRGKR